jgi:MFS family permease
MRQGPLAGRYPAAAAMVVFALVPYLGISAALQSISPIIGSQLHMSSQALGLTFGMANAGYAVGTVLAVQFAQHLPQRRMMVLYAALLLIGSVLAAAAPDAGLFIAGHVMQGLCTSLLLIAAAPPLFLGYPQAKLRWTAMIMNVCIFGAVALGPVIGGIQASAHAWRPLFWVVSGIALAALVLSLLTFEDAPPADRSAPKDVTALGLAASGCAAAFFGASQLTTHRFMDAIAFGPLIGGLVLIVILLVNQYRSKRPLLIVRSLVSTIPIAGIVVAICAAAASVSAIALTGALLEGRYSPLHLGLLYLPEFGGAVISAVLLGLVFRTRMIHYLVLTGVVCLSVGIVVIGGVLPPTQALTLLGSGLIGVGIGASVVPGLFLAGFSLRSGNIQRVFAIVELMRAVAAFMISPILAHLAVTVGGSATAGTRIALWICFGLVTGGALVGIALYALGRVRPPAPAMERWFGGEPAWESPPLLAAIRRESGERTLAERLAPTPTHADGRPQADGSGSRVRGSSPSKGDR